MDQTLTAEVLYQQHRHRVYHLCLRLSGGNHSWAEDATHDVFIKLLERLGALSEVEDLGGWIYRVTMNTCLTRLRREGSVWGKVRRALLGVPTASGDTPERKLRLQQDLQRALDLVAELPPRQRVVFCMRFLDEQPQREIAAALNISEGHVSKLLDRTRRQVARLGWEAPDA